MPLVRELAPLPYRFLLPAAIPNSKRLEEDARQTMEDLASGSSTLTTDLPFQTFVAENARTLQDLGNLFAGIEYLRFLEGEKHLILVTEKGLFLPRTEDDERIAEVAASARVVIDTVETGGLYIGQGPGIGPNRGQWSQFWAFTALRRIAELTGGRSSITEYTRQAVDRIDASTRAGYLLAYYPKNRNWDGRYRKIEVKVARPGVTVLYRHGYDATDELVPFDRQSFLVFNRIISAALYSDEVRDIRVSAKATRDRVDVKADLSRVSFRLEEGRHVARLHLAVFGTDSRDRVADERWATIEITLTEDQFEQRRREVTYSMAMAGKPAVREVKVVVYDYAGDLLGSTTARVF